MNDLKSLPVYQLHRTLGATPLSDSRVRFCVWSPTSTNVSVCLEDDGRRVMMKQQQGGYHVAEIDGVKPGDRYLYQFDEGTPRPDPASRYQPDGVHGPSEVVSRDFDWSDNQWRGMSQEALVIYELHIGTFTQKGTFASAIDRLDELVELGITAIEL
ncbi:MAG: HAD-IIB family hydrolase, partial [Rubripirellula sp.]